MEAAATKAVPPTAAGKEADKPATEGPQTQAPRPSRLQAVLARANSGDQTVLPELKQALDEHPSIWQDCYQLVSMTEQAWLDKITGKNLLLSQSIRRHVEKLKLDLAGPSPSPLEKLLAERIAACWLGVHHAEFDEAAGDSSGGGKVAQMRLKRLDAANKRFLAATKALAVTRRLTAGLKIEIRHTHGSPSEVPEGTEAGTAQTSATAGRAGRIREVDGDPADKVPVADRLRGLIKENVGTEAALASGVGV